MKETERIIRDISETLLTCRRALGFRNLNECKRAWLEQQETQAKQTLADLGVDRIIAIRDGHEIDEVVIFQADE